jgi:hypothetical protein
MIEKCPNCGKEAQFLYGSLCHGVIHCGCYYNEEIGKENHINTPCKNKGKLHCETDDNCTCLDKRECYLTVNRTWVGNCLLFYRKNGNGYTCNINDAEVFSRAEAEKYARMADGKYQIWDANYIKSKAVLHVDSELIDYSKAINYTEEQS